MSEYVDRSDELLELFDGDERRNGTTYDDDWPPPPDEPPADDDEREPTSGDAEEPTTWEPIDLEPYLSGDVEQPIPRVGLSRSDGVRLIYSGREHAVLGGTESGKTWFALACAAAELEAGNRVVYVHYEEGDAASTVERLRLLGVADVIVKQQLRFVAPSKPVRAGWLTSLLTPAPTLVIHDGVNEAMALHGDEIKDAGGASAFRRNLITPCTRTGAATLACDHIPLASDSTRRDAYGSVHKGNALDGARFLLENVEPFGRQMRGVSYVFATKDRPGHLRKHGRATKTPGKTFVGTFVVDDSETVSPDFSVRFFAPNDDRPAESETNTLADLAQIVHDVIAAQDDQTVASKRKLFAAMRAAGHSYSESATLNAVDDLVLARRVRELRGKRGALGYQAVLTAATTAASESAT